MNPAAMTAVEFGKLVGVSEKTATKFPSADLATTLYG
jgi:hypothetical protein